MSFSTGISLTGGNLQDEKVKKKINVFFDKFFDTFKESALKTNIGLANFDLGKPNNFYFAIDRKKIHFIYSSDFAGGIKEIIYVDLRDQQNEDFPIQDVALFFKSQKGFTKWRGFSIESEILLKSDGEIQKEASDLAIQSVQQEFQELIKKHQPLFISVEQIANFLDKASEDEFTQLLLVPLLRHIGFITAESKGHRDKSLEFGQDIQRMKIQIPTGHWLYFSAQVKKGNIKANTKKLKDNVNQVLNQTSSQLEWAMPDVENNIEVKPDHILLIVSGDITEEAKKFIFGHELYKRKRILLWERETICPYVVKKDYPNKSSTLSLNLIKEKI